MGKLFIILIAALLCLPASAQVTTNGIMGYRSSTGCPAGQATCFAPFSNTNPLPITGSLSSSTVGFNQTGVGTPLNVTTTSAPSAAFTSSTEVIVSNTSNTTPVYCTPGNAVATSANQQIQPGTWFPWYASGGLTQISCVTLSGTSTVNFTLGTGVPTSGPSAPSIGTVSNAGTINTSGNNQGVVGFGYGYNGTSWGPTLLDGSGFLQVNTAAGGLQGFPPGTVWSGSNGVGIAAGEQHMGEVGAGGGILASSALGVTAVPHPAGSCLGTLVTFSNAVRNNAAALSPGTQGTIQNIVIGFTSSAVPTNIDAIFFTSNPSTNPCNAADNATYTLASGDVGKALPAVPLTHITLSAASSLMDVSNIAMRYGLANSTTLYAVLVVRVTAFTPALGTTFNISEFRD